MKIYINLEIEFKHEINDSQPVDEVGTVTDTDEVETVTDTMHLNATSSLCPQYVGYTLGQ